MRDAFLLSVRLHARWFIEAFGTEGRRAAPLGPRRLAVLLILFPLFLLLQAIHWLGFLLDELFFSGWRRVEIRQPLFISGVPRSGTTFLHRTLARDTASFTTFHTWEALLAPSVSERKLFGLFAALDRLLGRPLQRFGDALTRRVTGGFAHIHEVGLQAAEEDYLTLLPAGGCFILVLAFPASESLWLLGRLRELPDCERTVLLNFYRSCLQKHLYVNGRGRRLLSKNAAFGSWLPDLAENFDDSRFLICLREPGGALRSQLSSIRDGLVFFGTTAAADLVTHEFRTSLEHVYQQLREQRRCLPASRFAVIDHSQLQNETQTAIAATLRQLEIPLTDALQRVLEDAAREARDYGGSRGHVHSPLSESVAPQPHLVSIYREILEPPADST